MNDIMKMVFQEMNQICIECGRTFDLLDDEQANEWHAGHDCEGK